MHEYKHTYTNVHEVALSFGLKIANEHKSAFHMYNSKGERLELVTFCSANWWNKNAPNWMFHICEKITNSHEQSYEGCGANCIANFSVLIISFK